MCVHTKLNLSQGFWSRVLDCPWFWIVSGFGTWSSRIALWVRVSGFRYLVLEELQEGSELLRNKVLASAGVWG